MTYIDPRGKAFSHLDRLAGWQRGEKPAPVTIEWDLSNRCHLGCQDCHFSHTHTKGPWTQQARAFPQQHDPGGDLADLYLVLRVFTEAKAAGVQGIVWTGGGEPTTHPSALTVFSHAYATGFEQGMYTAGNLLTERVAGAIKKWFSWVVVSLDHGDRDSYAKEKRSTPALFDKACQGVQWLSGGHAAIGVSFLLHEQNWRQAPQFLALSRQLGSTYTTFRPLIRTSPAHPGLPLGDRSWVTDALPLLTELAQEMDVETDPARFVEWATWEKHPYPICYGIRLNTTITPDGRMWVCPNRRAFHGSCLGDLREESFEAIWARHPGLWSDFSQCRAMCRLHPVNQTLASVYANRTHEAFI